MVDSLPVLKTHGDICPNGFGTQAGPNSEKGATVSTHVMSVNVDPRLPDNL